MPSEAVAESAEAELSAQAIVVERVPIVRRRPDEVEANAVAAPVRRALETSLEKAVKPIDRH
jgi:hypothetical protein